MKKTLLIILLYFMGCLLIPCLVTLAIGDRTGKSDKEVQASEGESVGAGISEDFVVRCVAAYYENGDNKEFLKALAVIARTYEKNSGEYDFVPNLLTYTELKDKWGDYYTANYEAVVNAVNETKGIVIQSESEEVLPYFCILSAGYTRGMAGTILAPANCSDDLKASDYMTVVSYKQSDVQKKIKDHFPELRIEGNISDSFQVISRDEAGYVTSVMVGNLTVSGDELSKVLALNSSNFMVTNSDNNMIFTVKGNGNGYGMSLYTARQKAVSGAGYREILFYFYKNITLSE